MLSQKLISNNWEEQIIPLRDELNNNNDTNNNTNNSNNVYKLSYFDYLQQFKDSPSHFSHINMNDILRRWKIQNLHLADSCQLLETRLLFELPYLNQTYELIVKEVDDLSRW